MPATLGVVDECVATFARDILGDTTGRRYRATCPT